MSYLISIKTALIIFPLIAFIFTIPFILHQYHKYGSINKLRVLIVYSFILYMITIYFLVILPLPNKEDVINNTHMYRLEPFAFIKDFINETSLDITNPNTYLKSLTESCFYVPVFNVIMTIPFGIYLRYYYKFSFRRTILFTFFLSLFFELTQLTGLYFIYPKPYRLFDLDDLIQNTTGGIIGYFIVGLLNKFLPTRDSIDQKSYEDGQKVSGLRRVTLYILDLFIFILLSLFVIHSNKFAKLALFIVYYILIPHVQNGQTIAGKFLNVSIKYENKTLIYSIIRSIFLLAYYILIPLLFQRLAIYNINHHFHIAIFISLIATSLLFPFINILILIKNNHLFYDKLFKSTYISTIKINTSKSH